MTKSFLIENKFDDISSSLDTKLDADGGIASNLSTNDEFRVYRGDFVSCINGQSVYGVFKNVIRGEIPTASQYVGYYASDVNGIGASAGSTITRLGCCEFGVLADGSISAKFGAYRNVANETEYRNEGLVISNVKQDGTSTLTYGDKPVIVKTAETKGANWYRKYSDGWIEQGGRETGLSITSDGSVTITYPIAFTSSNVTVAANHITNSLDGYSLGHLGLALPTATNFTYANDWQGSTKIIAVIWYACGY